MPELLTDHPRTLAHPLAPLAADEVRAAARAALAAAGEGARVLGATPKEPDKPRYLAWRADPQATPRPPREALVSVVDVTGITETTIDLATVAVTERRPVAGAQPPITPEEYERAAAAVLVDERVRRALAARGVIDTTELRTELGARRDADGGRSRSWLVESAERRNAHGSPTAYRLVPGHGTATLLAQPDSSVERRAGFARHTLWVTPRDPGQRHPAGTYPYGRVAADGLPHWTQADRPLQDTDVVLWYTVGVTHFVRPEDWPIMPMTRAGFALEPVGFFDRNPTLDTPPTPGCAH